MRRHLGIFVGLLTACIEPALVPCGDLVCPAGFLCDANRCVAPNAFEACVGISDGDACRLDDRTTGRCDGAACIVTSCGNGRIEVGEICDDGNQESEPPASPGAHCNATCTSDETCGNGIVDVGESCDCGSATAPTCASPNGDDPDATCRSDCTPARCGDGIVGQFELCDGEAPAGSSCVGFGYDLGTMSCASCGPGFARCHDLGFERAHAVVAKVHALSGWHGHVGVIYEGGATYVVGDGLDVKAASSYELVAATTAGVWAVSRDHVGRWTASGWLEGAAPWTASPTSLWADDTAVYVMFADATIVRFDGATSTTIPPTPTVPMFGVAPFAHTHGQPTIGVDDTIYTWTGSTWTSQSFPWASQLVDIFDDQLGRTYLRFGVFNTQLARVTAQGNQELSISGSVNAAVGTDDGVVLLQTVIDSPITTILEVDPVRPFLLATQGAFQLIASDGSIPYVALPTGLYAMTRGTWVGDPSMLTTRLGWVPGSSIVYPSPVVELTETNAYVSIASPEDCTAALVDPAGGLVCATTVHIVDGATTIPFAGETLLWGGADGSIAALRMGGMQTRIGGIWRSVVVDPALGWQAVAGDRLEDLFAIAVRSDSTPVRAVFHFDGTAWTEVAPLDGSGEGLAVLPDRVLALRSADVLVVDRATGGLGSLALPAPLGSLATGIGSDAIGLVRGFTDTSPLWRYDGVAWTQIAIPADLMPASVERAGESIIVKSGVSLFGNSNYRLVRTRAWN